MSTIKAIQVILSTWMLHLGFCIMPAGTAKQRLVKLLLKEVTDYVEFNPFNLEPYGHCPVQIEGTINGQRFYFRARYRTITFQIAPDEDKLFNPYGKNITFSRSLDYGNDPYAAGYLNHNDAIRLCTVWLNEFVMSEREKEIALNKLENQPTEQ